MACSCHFHTYPVNVLSLYTLCQSMARVKPVYFARIETTDHYVGYRPTCSRFRYIYSLAVDCNLTVTFIYVYSKRARPAYSVSWAVLIHMSLLLCADGVQVECCM